MTEKLNFLKGTQASYNALTSKNENTFYRTSDKNLYLGDIHLNKQNVVFGTCMTRSDLAEKEIVITDSSWTITEGAILFVQFAATNTVSYPKFKINNQLYSVYTARGNDIADLDALNPEIYTQGGDETQILSYVYHNNAFYCQADEPESARVITFSESSCSETFENVVNALASQEKVYFFLQTETFIMNLAFAGVAQEDNLFGLLFTLHIPSLGQGILIFAPDGSVIMNTIEPGSITIGTDTWSEESGAHTDFTNAVNTLIQNYKPNYYGVCDTAASIAAKEVTISGYFKLEPGAMIVVKFTKTNTASTPTLNVNNTGAKPLYRYGTTKMSSSSATTGWSAGAVQLLVYDGTGWIRTYWANSTYSNATLGQGYGVCETEEATLAKTASISNYSLSTGGIVAIRFINKVLANSTLSITDRDAKPIYYNNAAITDNVIQAGDTATFIYNGAQYHLLSISTLPTALKNPNSLIFTGASTETYDGSGEVSVNLIGWKGTQTGAEIFNNSANSASGYYSHAEGYSTAASGNYTHAEGSGTKARGDYSHTEGYNTQTQASTFAAHAEGYSTEALGSYTHAEGYGSIAKGNEAHAEGWATQSLGPAAHTEGVTTYAIGRGSHAEGAGIIPDLLLPSFSTMTVVSSKANSTAITVSNVPSDLRVGSVLKYNGLYALVTGIDSDTKISVQFTQNMTSPNPLGNLTNATVSVLNGTTSYGESSHAEGKETTAIGFASHAEGLRTIASGRGSHAEGMYNIQSAVSLFDNRGTYVHIVGNGTAENARSNAHTLDWDGNAWFAGDVYVGSTSGTNKDTGSKKLATENYVDTHINTALSSVLTYKGTKSTTSELPTSGNVTGDVWNITNACEASGDLPKVNAGDNVAWNGSTWDVLAGIIDLSNYLTGVSLNGTALSVSNGVVNIPLSSTQYIPGIIKTKSTVSSIVSTDYVATPVVGGSPYYGISKLRVGASGATANAVVDKDPYLTSSDGGAYRSQVQFVGGGATTIKSTSSGSFGKIEISSTDTNTTYTFAAGDSNGQIKVTPSEGDAYNVSVKGLAAAAYKGVTDSSSASAIGTGTNLVTERDIYYGLPSINNSRTYTSDTTIYAPTYGGTSGWVLRAVGATSAPIWESVKDSTSASAISTGTNLVTERDVYYGLASINNARQTSSVSIYAPTTGGTAGYTLVAAGATSAPTWNDTLTVDTTTGVAIKKGITLDNAVKFQYNNNDKCVDIIFI